MTVHPFPARPSAGNPPGAEARPTPGDQHGLLAAMRRIEGDNAVEALNRSWQAYLRDLFADEPPPPSYDWRKMGRADRVLMRLALVICIAGGLFTVAVMARLWGVLP